MERSVGGLKIRGTVNICLMGDPGIYFLMGLFEVFHHFVNNLVFH